MSPAAASAPIWRAGRDGLGHAIARASDLRGACGERVVAERNAWTVVERCIPCVDRVGIVVAAPSTPPDRRDWTQSELRFADGDR